MRARKPIIILLILFSVLLLGACSSKDTGARKLWDKFVRGINEKNIELIAETYNTKGSSAYNQYIEDEKNKLQFETVDKITTKSFELLTTCDISSSSVKQKYYSAKVNATVVYDETDFDLEFEVYMSLTNDTGWFFTNEVSVDPLAEKNGNLPNDLWLRSALHEYEDYLYKASYVMDGGNINYTAASISSYEGNAKNVVIPSEINGLPVTTIKKYAFMKLGSIFEITLPNSKMTSLTIPDTVTTIEEYAFFQSSKLKELVIPSSVKSIGEFAFASSKRLSKLVFNIDDSALYTEDFLKEIASKSDSGIVISGARNLYVGDLVNLKEASSKLVTWSVDKTNVATIDADKGTVVAKSPGTVTITAALKSDPTIKATVTVTVSPSTEIIKVQSSAFERCHGLKEIYIYARNPYSLGIAGTSFKFPSDVTIYVPKGSKEVYANSSNWTAYKVQIKEME